MAMSEEKSPAESIAGLIPDVYYDIIARLIPGSIFLLLLEWIRIANPAKCEYLNFEDFLGYFFKDELKTSQILLYIIFSYIIGFFLSKAVGLVECLVNYLAEKIKCGTINESCEYLKNSYIFINKLYSCADEQNPKKRGVIIKMLGELVLFESILLISIIGLLYKNLFSPEKQLKLFDIEIFSFLSIIAIIIILIFFIIHQLHILKERSEPCTCPPSSCNPSCFKLPFIVCLILLFSLILLFIFLCTNLHKTSDHPSRCDQNYTQKEENIKNLNSKRLVVTLDHWCTLFDGYGSSFMYNHTKKKDIIN